MEQNPTATPQVMPNTVQELEVPESSQKTLQPRLFDDVAKESLIKAGKSDADLVAGLEDQLPATEINRKPPSEDTDMAFVPKIDPTEPWIKAEKPDTDLAASIHKQDAATDLDPTELLIKVEKLDSDLAASIENQKSTTGAKQEPYREDTEMPLAPKFDLNEPIANLGHSDSECSLASFNPQDLLEEKRTPSSLEFSDKNIQGQLCVICFKEWERQLKPSERLLDCQITQGNSPGCDPCAQRRSNSHRA
ncbi:hypothetical protein Pdw03_0965 [Penicillium digitatum]|uniref:Uncharacterized protein n=1 Tax=Penicillium digitatum TaxID=36651 RepID=A0A7T6XS55_PENDI|nr:hypothetical protein Pdw03_0965 [Penicillium digitatum]